MTASERAVEVVWLRSEMVNNAGGGGRNTILVVDVGAALVPDDPERPPQAPPEVTAKRSGQAGDILETGTTSYRLAMSGRRLRTAPTLSVGAD